MMEYILWSVAFIGLYLTIVWLNILYLEKERKVQKKAPYPSVCIVVPAYNEEESIVQTLENITKLDYPKEKLEVIIVDDASNDHTKEKANEFIKKEKRKNIIFIRKKKNEGKAAALNTALKKTTADLFACVDADTFVKKDALKKIVPRLSERRVAAAISTIKVENPSNVYGKVQKIEYLIAIFMRMLMTFIHTLHITPGALSIYRTNVIKKVDGFDNKNITEDFEIAMRLKSRGYDVVLERESVVYTKVPITMQGLWNQRIRWSRGFLYNHFKYRRMVLNKKYGVMGLFQLPLNLAGPPLLIAGIFAVAYLTGTRLYDFVLKSIIIRDYLKNELLSFTSPIDWLLSTNMKVMFPIFLSAVLGIYVFYLAHKLSDEKIKHPGSIVTYFFLMPYLVALYWVSACIQEISKKKRKW